MVLLVSAYNFTAPLFILDKAATAQRLALKIKKYIRKSNGLAAIGHGTGSRFLSVSGPYHSELNINIESGLKSHVVVDILVSDFDENSVSVLCVDYKTEVYFSPRSWCELKRWFKVNVAPEKQIKVNLSKNYWSAGLN